MARAYTRKNISIDENIRIQEDSVAKAKERYDKEVSKLKDMYAKRDEMKKKELLKAVETSSRSYEEIMAFLAGKDGQEK